MSADPGPALVRMDDKAAVWIATAILHNAAVSLATAAASLHSLADLLEDRGGGKAWDAPL